MAATQSALRVDMKENMSEKPPVYREAVEKQSTPCANHGVSTTPHLDKHLQSPSAKEHLHNLSSAIANIADTNCCARCATKEIASIMAEVVRDIKTAKNDGQWSREEKKAYKAEFKGLFKEMKRNAKQTWRTRPST